MKKDIILIGGGGHSVSSIDVIESTNDYNIIGIIDLAEKIGETVLGYKVIASEDDLREIRKTVAHAVVTVGHINSSALRTKMFELLKSLDFDLPAIISSNAYVSNHSSIGEGTMVFHGAIVNAEANIGVNCIINTRSLIEHGAQIGHHCHISTGAVINGDVNIGNHCFMGSGSVTNHSLSVCDYTIVGSQASVIKDIVKPGTYVGVPAQLKE